MNKDRVVFVVKVLAIVVSLYLFLVGIAGIGHSFQLFGGEFSEGVLTATESPVVALFIGILATSLVQSSSTTSSVIVGLVAGGTIPTEAAVFMIMGANVGTTVTNTIVSVGHIAQGAEFRRAFAAATVHDFFNLMAVAILFPLEWATGFLSYASVFLATAFAGLGGLQVGSPVKAATGPAVSALATAVGQQGTWQWQYCFRWSGPPGSFPTRPSFSPASAGCRWEARSKLGVRLGHWCDSRRAHGGSTVFHRAFVAKPSPASGRGRP